MSTKYCPVQCMCVPVCAGMSIECVYVDYASVVP